MKSKKQPQTLSFALFLGLGLFLALLWLLSGHLPLVRAADLTVCAGGCNYTTIQTAVDAAATGDIIKVAEGDYTDLHLRSGITQTVYVSKTITIRGGYTSAFTEPPDPLAHPTTLDAGGLGRGLVISGPVTVTVEGLCITGGDASGLGGGPDGWDAAGGIYVNMATAIISNCLIYDNIASTTDSYAYGGGIYLHYGVATLTGNTIQNNTADAGSSGYGLGGGLATWNNPVTLISNTVQNNTAAVVSAPFGEGGGIYMVYGQGAVVSDNVISGNVAGYEGHGGGLYLIHSPATLNDNQVLTNTASTGGTRRGRGGGLLLNNSPAMLNHNLIQGNLAGTVSPGDGGGLFLDGSDAYLNGNQVIGNTARDTLWGGGGIAVVQCNPTLTNTIVARNVIVGTGAGAGICMLTADSHLAYTTVADNSGGDGAGICVKSGSTVTFTDTILANQTVGITVTAGCSADMQATLWHGNGTNAGGAGSIVTGTVNVSGDPAFVNPAGGDYHIGPASAAIDQGVDAGADDDVDGDARPQGGGYDIGADERVSTGLSADFSIAKAASANTIVAGERITYTLTITNGGPDGPAAARVVDTFTPADAVESLSWSGGSCTYVGGVADCAVDNVPVATPSTLELYVTASSAYSGTLSNTAIITGSGSTVDPNNSNNSAGPVAVAVRLLTSDLSISQAVQSNQATAGESIALTLTLTNGGPDSPATAWVVDTIEPAVAIGSIGWSGGTCTYAAAGLVQCTVENVYTAAPSTLELFVTTTSAYSGTLTNTATITGSGVTVDPNDSNNSAGPVVVTVHTPMPPPPAEYTVCSGGSCDFTTIQAAVDAVNPCSNDVIKVAEGIYTDLHARDGITQVVYISKTVTIRGGYTTAFTEPPDPIAHPTTLDAGGLGRGLVIDATMLPCEFAPTAEGLRITGGDATGLGGSPDGWDAGGGVYVSVDAYAAQATISNCVITGNVGTTDGVGEGGGLYLNGENGTLSGNTISGNAAATGDWNTGEGGGLYLRINNGTLTNNVIQSNTGISGTDGWGRGGGVYLYYGAPTLNDNLILDNVASEGTTWGHGGGLYLNNSPATLNGNVIQSNVAGTADGYYFGGGAYLLYSNATLNDNQLLDNIASSNPDNSGGMGGGLYSWYGDVMLNGNRVQGNTASRHDYSSGSGGGLYLDHHTVLLNANTIVANVGGGIFSTLCDTALTNTIIAGNLITGTRVEQEEGAGMRIGGGHATLIHSTIAGNSGGAGSGVKVSGGAQVTMVNTILVSHTTGLTVTAGSTVTLNTTLWYSNGTDYGGPGNVTIGGDINGQDPLLDVTYHLRSGSPAIDSGIDAGAKTDVDGDLRPQGGGYDIGADERMIPIVADLSIGKTASSGSVTAGRSVTYTLTITNHGPDGPARAWVMDTLDPAIAVAGISWPGQVCSRQGVVISCLVENVLTTTPSTLGLIVTTQDTFSGTLSNTATITGVAGTVDPNGGNNYAGPVTVRVTVSEGFSVYLPLVLRAYGP